MSRTRNHFFDTVATVPSWPSISYSWSTTLPWAFRSDATVDVDLEAVADADQRLLHHGLATAELDGDGVADAELPLADRGDLVAGGVLEHPGVAEADGLAVDLVGLVAAVVLDPVVVADRDELLPHLVATGIAATTANPVTQSHVSHFRPGAAAPRHRAIVGLRRRPGSSPDAGDDCRPDGHRGRLT